MIRDRPIGCFFSEYAKQMIHFFIGTKAQFIKMAPVMVEMKTRDIPFRYIDSGQHAALTRSLRKGFNLSDPNYCLRQETEDITFIGKAISWYGKNIFKTFFNQRWLKEEVFAGGGICLIHGDTLSTLLGLQMAIRAGLRVAHVEAGLRSFNVLSPFPEELIRIYCMRRSDLLFAPSDETAENLIQMKIRGQVVKIDGNTVADSLRLAGKAASTASIPEDQFVLATCHRLETITKSSQLKKVVALMNRIAEQIPVVFVAHKPTQTYLKRFGLNKYLHPGISKIDILGYADFIATLKAARFVLTDGGSIQEECAYLNKPCLIIRKTTERLDGLGKNATLWTFDNEKAESFLAKAMSSLKEDATTLPRPSEKIVKALVKMGFAG